MTEPTFCKLDFCKAPAELLRIADRVLTSGTEFHHHEFRVFCGDHNGQFWVSCEGGRIRLQVEEGPDAVPFPLCRMVAALSDFRTRVELEHRRDHDVQVIQARGGK